MHSPDNPHQHATDLLAQAVTHLKLKLDPNLDLGSTIETTKIEFGDFASNLALRLAPSLQMKPLELADQIRQKLLVLPGDAEATVAGPGFINIRLGTDYWLQYLNNLRQIAKPAKPNGQSVNIEFVSANPTGPLVFVNAWQAFYGDILARVYAHDGWRVEREYYSNDTGNQILNLGKSILATAGVKYSDDEIKNFYKGDYIDDLAAEMSIDDPAKADAYVVGRRAAGILFDRIQASLKRMNIRYDRFFSENDLDNEATLELLRAKGMLDNHDGAVWLKAAVIGGDQDRVLVRSGGKGQTYFLKDISYQLDKLVERKYDLAITITGADHHGEMLFLAKALAALGYENFLPLNTQIVRLIEDGREVKMSKRAGKYILLDDFLDLVPTDVARFYFGMRDIHSHFDFDLKEAQTQSKNNPLFYAMYAYARSCSILEKARSEAVSVASSVTHDLTSFESALVRQAAQLQTTISLVPDNHKVHSIFHELLACASLFHDYYEQERILTITDHKLRASKLALVQIWSDYFELIFELLGITPQSKM